MPLVGDIGFSILRAIRKINMDTNLKYVVDKKNNAATLLKKYNHLKKNTKTKIECINSYKKYKVVIMNDIPRTYPDSKWMNHFPNQMKVIQLLRVFLVYSNIGYLQGMMFIAVPLLKMFENQEYLAFWSFVDITEMLKPFYMQVMMDLDNFPNNHVNEVLVVWKRFKKVKVTNEEENMIRIVLHWKMMGTLFFSICGNNLNNINVLLKYFMTNLHCKKIFLRKVKAFALAILLSFFPSKITSERIELWSTCTLSGDALLSVLKTARQSEFVFL